MSLNKITNKNIKKIVCVYQLQFINSKSDGIASNRLFEGLAAGVPLICDKNPFIQEWFKDNVFYIDTSRTNCAEQIINHIIYIRANPSIVLKKMAKCRKIFIDNFLLDKQISSLLLNLPNNKLHQI
jgi:glycosyltransferase involved in cell wall biosynthesis